MQGVDWLCREVHMGAMLCRSSLPLLCLHTWSARICMPCYVLNDVQALLSLGPHGAWLDCAEQV